MEYPTSEYEARYVIISPNGCCTGASWCDAEYNEVHFMSESSAERFIYEGKLPDDGNWDIARVEKRYFKQGN